MSENPIVKSSRLQLCSFTLNELKEQMKRIGEPVFRAQQVFEWVYRKGAASFDAMTNLSKEFRIRLEELFQFPSMRQIESVQSEETVKFLWELSDGLRIESVLIQSFDRRTVCVSSQVGCPGRCAFCASGKGGLIRSLSAAEIVEQVLHIDRLLREKGERVCHIVYMGMGEPLENYDAVVKSIRILNDENSLHISQRRITVSTVGIASGIHRLANEDFKVNLALSLHASNQQVRQKIIPFAKKYPLEEILMAVDDYARLTKRDITYEYTLIADINDGPLHAVELASILRGKQCTVNLIPFNPIENMCLQRPKNSQIKRFREILHERGVNTTWRYSKGADISAACGQLALSDTQSKHSQIS
jgi:23S rRNA (adenine2503-C2)-methyltransferase